MFVCQSHLNDFVNYMITKHSNINLIRNLRNDCFCFLDVTITRSNNPLVTSISHKATFIGAFTNFRSFIPVAYKFGLVYTLLQRSFPNCSSYRKFHEEIILFKKIFRKNEYLNFFLINV